MLHNVVLDGKCQIYNTMFPQAYTLLKAEQYCFKLSNWFCYADIYKVKSSGIYLLEENM